MDCKDQQIEKYDRREINKMTNGKHKKREVAKDEWGKVLCYEQCRSKLEQPNQNRKYKVTHNAILAGSTYIGDPGIEVHVIAFTLFKLERTDNCIKYVLNFYSTKYTIAAVKTANN